jgi:DNA-binding NarL/FixJ family response regulator
VARQTLGEVIEAFASTRRLSPRQRLILELHLNGQNDKGIAVTLGCELTTVYEHWRRMGRKSGGAGKSDVVADFHRCLARDLPLTSERQ